MKLIDKSALVAEIEKRRKKNARNKLNLAAAFEDNYLLSFIDTLEVKEVDLNEEIETCLKQHSMLAVGKKDFTDIAKHFFELGIKAKNK